MTNGDTKHPRPELKIDGNRFSTLEGFFDEVGEVLFGGRPWERSLEAFGAALDEMLSEYGPMSVVWLNSEKSRVDLGYPETLRQIVERLKYAHPDSRQAILFELEKARNREGDTVFTWLVDTFGRREGLKLELV